MKQQNNIALIFFSRKQVDEAKHKSWFREHSKNHELASLLIDRAHSTVLNSGIPMYHFHEGNQKGNTFGERIANAYQEIFDLGYERVISVGNDCPELNNLNWQEISDDLAKGKSVLGPDTRGGAYLIGIHKTSFDKVLFENLSWQKNTLYKELVSFCKNTTILTELEQYRDINSIYDIQIITNTKKSFDKFFILLYQILRPKRQLNISLQLSHHDFYIFKDSPLRAPPFYKAA